MDYLKNKTVLICLIFIVALAIFWRFFMISSVPPSPSLDEATIGYNAYSLLLTGHDEYGYKFPLLLRAYDDYRPALYVYLTIPFIKFLGLQVLSVRLPSIILSTLTVFSTFFLTKELVNRSKFKNYSKAAGLLSSFFLAISPWHIYISRLGHEVNAGVSFIIFGATFFLIGLQKDRLSKFFLPLSGVFFALSFYTYQSEKVFTPLLVIILFVCFIKDIIRQKKNMLLSAVIFILFSLPIFFVSLSPQALIRLHGTSAFSGENISVLYQQSAVESLHARQTHDVFGQMITNRRLIPVKIFLGNYFSHLSPQWLFSNSGDESFKAPNTGLFYVFELPLIILGVFFSLRKKLPYVVWLWIGISFVAPAITTQAPHAMRAMTIFPIPQIIEAAGAIGLYILLRNKILQAILVLTLLTFAIVAQVQFFTDYFVLFPKQQSHSFEYALSQAMMYVLHNQNKYQQVVFSNKDNTYQSYMFYLFDSHYDPRLYASEGGTISGGFAQAHHFGKFTFTSNDLSLQTKDTNTLYVDNLTNKPLGLNLIQSFYNLDNQTGVGIYSK